MDLNETKEFVQILQRLQRLYPQLTNIAATEAVNFVKERFVKGVDINDKKFRPRKNDKKTKSSGRAVLVKRGILKRDVHKVYVGETRAMIGTTRITSPYAKAHNEGFKGTVRVKEFKRNRYKRVKEKYTTRKGNERTRTSKQIAQTAAIAVRTHLRKMNLPQRQYMGNSAVLDKRLQNVITNAFIQTLKTS